MNNKIAMLKRWLMILRKENAVAVKQGVGTCYEIGKIRGYYNDLTRKVGDGTELDDQGIPLTTIADHVKVYFPIAIFQYGLGCYDLYCKTGEDYYKNAFYKIAEWAEKNMKEDGSWDCFFHLHSSQYNVSSMCQGEGASLLYRAYVDSGNDIYRALAERAVDFMLLPIEDGGTAKYEGEGLYLEEYPQKQRRSVLNGWIFSLFGLYDAYIINPEKYSERFIQTSQTLENTIEKYDMGFWSRYDLDGNIASPAYHDLHISQLKVLYEMTESDSFMVVARHFEKYQHNRLGYSIAVVLKAMQKMLQKTEMVVIK